MVKVKGLDSGAALALDTTPIDYVVDGMIQAGTVNIAVGDSGLGKSALFYQLGVAVAAGKPFLGLETKPGPVIMFDYENGKRKGTEIAFQVSRFLGLEATPDAFYRWSEEEAFELFETMLGSVKPRLVLIDALRGYKADAEVDNPRAAAMLAELYRLSRKHGTAFLLAHHTRKNRDPKFPPPRLDDLNVSPLTWCEEAAGPRALVNQTHSRIGIARGEGDSALILRGHLKTEGEFGPIYVARAFDEYGDPAGYRRRAPGAGLTAEQKAILNRLPDTFTFKMAKLVAGKSDGSVHRLLARFVASGAVGKNTQLKTFTKTPAHILSP